MKNQVHKPDDGKAKVRQGIKTRSQVAHPILQLQQIAGNKAVTKLIQRHPSDGASEYRGVMIRWNQTQIDSNFWKTQAVQNRVDLLEGVVKAQTGRMNRHTQGGGHRI